jgi:MFS family permease
LIPAAADWGFGWMIIARVFQGLAYACCFAVVGNISTRWASLSGVSIFISMLTLFPAYSNVFTNTVSGLVCSSTLGWPWVHYIHGGVCAVLFILWFNFYNDQPKENKIVSSKELQTIYEGKTEAHKRAGRKVPYLVSFWLKYVEIWRVLEDLQEPNNLGCLD